MTTRDQLTAYLDKLLLHGTACKDKSNNGLQVEGARKVAKVVFGVDGCLQLFTAAARCGAQYVIVHHGLSWGDSLKYLTHLNAARVRSLFASELSLYAAHLPLDMHPEVGHNAEIARRLGLVNAEPCFEYGGALIGVVGNLPAPVSLPILTMEVDSCLGTESAAWDFGPPEIRRVGIVSGGGGDGIAECAAAKADCFITGEVLHEHWHLAQEAAVNVIAAGHYRSEIPGLLAVKARLEAAFDIECEFIDLPTGH